MTTAATTEQLSLVLPVVSQPVMKQAANGVTLGQVRAQTHKQTAWHSDLEVARENYVYLIHFFLEIYNFFQRFCIRSLEYSHVFSNQNIVFGRRYVLILKTFLYFLKNGVSEAWNRLKARESRTCLTF